MAGAGRGRRIPDPTVSPLHRQLASTLVGSSPSHPSVPSPARLQSPTQVALAWFGAINSKDPAALALYNQPGPGAWTGGSFPPSHWPTFSSVRCIPNSLSEVTAHVICTFTESQAPSVGNPDSFWSLYMDRHHDGRWFVTEYGQL